MTAADRPFRFPAVLYLPGDALDLETNQVMGRRVAGRLLTGAFASQLQRNELLTLFTPDRGDIEAIGGVLKPLLAPGARVQIARQLRAQALLEVGALHLPDPLLSQWCWLRDGVAPHAFSLTGVIHTLCSTGVLMGLQDLVLAPLYPWDAVVCTSKAGRQAVAAALEHRLEAMAARLGVPAKAAVGLPQLPVIPLAGRTTQPYHAHLDRAQRRRLARAELGISPDAFVVAFVGRLSFHSKAHPQPLYRALQALAPAAGPVTLIECGHHFNAAIASAYRDLQRHFPNVDFRLVGGLTPASEQDKWQVLAAADVFSSPADNLQETFGLALLEAMAAELPLVVGDWDGYRDLVEHGRNGLLVPTSDVLPRLLQADSVERAYTAGQLSYDQMVGLRSYGVVTDHHAFTAAFEDLRADPERRARMGADARQVLEQRFSEAVVTSLYRRLWGELAELRATAAREPLPTALRPEHPPYGRVFGHYASGPLDCDRVIVDSSCLSLDLATNAMNQGLMQQIAGGRLAVVLAELVNRGGVDVERLEQLGLPAMQARQILAALLKLGCVQRAG